MKTKNRKKFDAAVKEVLNFDVVLISLKILNDKLNRTQYEL